jgi:aryl-alcohol dehydrogenase-like predicted oxidoreductase
VDLIAELAVGYGVPYTHVPLAWVLSRPQVASVIIGVSEIDHIDENLPVGDFHLSNDDLLRLDHASAEAKGYPANMPAYQADDPTTA